MPIPLKDSVIYGPVDSRRLGRSLGVNILPTDEKYCAYNCVYCQYGWTKRAPSDVQLPATSELLEAIDERLKQLSEDGIQIDYLTIAGNGEPTLHPDFVEIVDAVLGMRDKYFPDKEVGILSDSYGVVIPEVREALSRLDRRFMKLDAGTEEVFRKINKPCIVINWTDMIEGLKSLQGIVIQSLFVKGDIDNSQPADTEAWARLVKDINPLSVHIYSLDRPPASDKIEGLSKDELIAINEQLKAAGYDKGEVFVRE